MFIAFSGMDGSGKSLQAKALTDSLHKEGYRILYVWSRWSPFFLRPIIRLGRALLGRKGNSEDEQYRSFQKDKRRLFQRASIMQLWKNLALLDYFLQVMFKIRLRTRENRIIICDRYLTDFLVDLSNNFGYGKDQMAQLCGSRLLGLFPRPDHLYLLDLPAKVAFDRKEDMPLSYLQDRRALYLNLGQLLGAEILDATAGIEDLQESIRQRTMTLLEGRGKRSPAKS
jgi:thymidylate kinase